MTQPCCPITPADLPDVLPIFPLNDVLLLPRGELPLNIFEPRYVAMINAALATPHRLIGIIQPQAQGPHGLYTTGCAGRISSFSETDDGRYLITLSGICRFDVTTEIETKDGYRRITTNFRPYLRDMDHCGTLNLDRARLLVLLKDYFKAQGISCRWESVKNAADEPLMTALAMTCPLSRSEKQALLEAPCPVTRAAMFLDILGLAVATKNTEGTERIH